MEIHSGNRDLSFVDFVHELDGRLAHTREDTGRRYVIQDHELIIPLQHLSPGIMINIKKIIDQAHDMSPYINAYIMHDHDTMENVLLLQFPDSHSILMFKLSVVVK